VQAVGPTTPLPASPVVSDPARPASLVTPESRDETPPVAVAASPAAPVDEAPLDEPPPPGSGSGESGPEFLPPVTSSEPDPPPESAVESSSSAPLWSLPFPVCGEEASSPPWSAFVVAAPSSLVQARLVAPARKAALAA
jgi:hypothetical protein